MNFFEWMIVGMVACLVGGLTVWVMRSVDADGLKKVDDAAGKRFDPSNYPRLVHMQMISLALLFGAIIFFTAYVVAKASSPVPPVSDDLAPEASVTPAPTVTFALGRTTPLPTREHVTPAPIVTPRPTPTPEPTPEPTPIPPLSLSGSGDDVIDLDMHERPVIHFKGGDDGGFLAVKGYDADGEYAALLISHVGSYDGVVTDFDFDIRTLEIKARGPWTLEAYTAEDVPFLSDEYEGSGDFVLALDPTKHIAEISGNEDGGFFAVTCLYYDGGHKTDLLAASTEPYSGRVMLHGIPLVLEIKADGPWKVKLS